MLKEFDFVNVPIVDIVNTIFIDASNKGASDIHYDPWEEFMKIRIRIDGELIDYAKVPNLASEARQKLNDIRPTTIGQASRISGVNPADISILMVYLRRNPHD